jgi:hypothetical protein
MTRSDVSTLARDDGEADRHHRIWRSVNVVKRLSDRIVGIGPFGLGIDGVLAWVPGAGPIYTVGAGAFLIGQALRSGASVSTMSRMVAYLAADTATSAVPFVGWAVDTLFPGHYMAATALQKDIEDRHGAPPEVPLKARTRKPRKTPR